VIGIDGALGKTNLTSSNIPRRRQFCASAILNQTMVSYIVSVFEVYLDWIVPAGTTKRRKISWVVDYCLDIVDEPVTQTMGHDHRRGVLLECGNNIGSA